MNKIKFIIKEINKGRLNYILFSIFTYPLSKTKFKNWRLKAKDEILIRNLTKRIKRVYGLNFLNTYSKFYCEALREIYEYKIYDFLKINEKDLVYDVGAGGGEYAILCAKKGAKALAFELRRDAYDLMNKNIKLNNFQDKIKTFFGAIDDKNTLDLYFSKTKAIPTIIKIDVEGMEMQVLEGSKKVLKEAAPKIILETHSRRLENDCLDFLFKFGYKIKKEIKAGDETNLLFLKYSFQK